MITLQDPGCGASVSMLWINLVPSDQISIFTYKPIHCPCMLHSQTPESPVLLTNSSYSLIYMVFSRGWLIIKGSPCHMQTFWYVCSLMPVMCLLLCTVAMARLSTNRVYRIGLNKCIIPTLSSWQVCVGGAECWWSLSLPPLGPHHCQSTSHEALWDWQGVSGSRGYAKLWHLTL